MFIYCCGNDLADSHVFIVLRVFDSHRSSIRKLPMIDEQIFRYKSLCATKKVG